MSTNLRKRIDTVAVKLGVTDPASDERPTPMELWLWRLESVVKHIVKWPHLLNKEKPESDEYDHHFLYAHREKLQTIEAVEQASDDVLLEALNLPDVEHWGWLLFMVRELPWYELLAANWGLPCLQCEYGGWSAVNFSSSDECERRARAALYFLDLMRERGVDALGDLRAWAAEFKAEKGMEEDIFLAHLREHEEWGYFVYTRESVVIRPEAQSDGGRVLYHGDFQAQFLHEIRSAARRRRRLAGVRV